MFSILLRCFIFLTFMLWYSLGIWNLVDSYFNGEFKKYLQEEYNSNVLKKSDVAIESLRQTCRNNLKYEAFNLKRDAACTSRGHFNYKYLTECKYEDYINGIFFLRPLPIENKEIKNVV